MILAPANDSRRVILFLSAFMLLAGGTIYLFLRPGTFVFHHWLQLVGLEGWYSQAISNTEQIAFIPGWMLYSLPNALWAFAYALLICGIWLGKSTMLKYFWFATIPILVLGFEGLQGLGIFPGTFSFLDLVFGLIGICAGIYTAIILIKQKKNEKLIE